MFQHTPRAVTVAPPSDVTLPPDVAVVVDIFVAVVVVIVGDAIFTDVVNVRSLP